MNPTPFKVKQQKSKASESSFPLSSTRWSFPDNMAVQASGSSHEEIDISLVRIFGFTTIAVGIQFGWALQLSLLTPYVQELGIPHKFASYIWLCGPISGILLQPTIGYLSDRCRSRWGRRRPFILGGLLVVFVALLLIAFSADLGHKLGDAVDSPRKTNAIVFFVLGFWILDLSNNVAMGPCRALMADYTGHSVTRSRKANAFYTFFLAVGNVLGYAAGAYSGWHKLFKFTNTTACDKDCANLKSAFMVDVVVLLVTTLISLSSLKELTLEQIESHKKQQSLRDPESGKQGMESQSLNGMWQFVSEVKHLAWELKYFMLVMALTWIAWYPFVLYDTDWVGRDVYKGNPSSGNQHLKDVYNKGVRMGSFGLMLNSVVLGLMSLIIERVCKKIGGAAVWGAGNFIMCLCYVVVIFITKIGQHQGRSEPSPGLLAGTMLLFCLSGVTLAVTYTVPYIVTMNFISSIEGGQGLAMGVLNQASVLPQLALSFIIGPWDSLFGGSNLPAFAAGSVVAFLGALAAWIILRRHQCCKSGGDDGVALPPR